MIFRLGLRLSKDGITSHTLTPMISTIISFKSPVKAEYRFKVSIKLNFTFL